MRTERKSIEHNEVKRIVFPRKPSQIHLNVTFQSERANYLKYYATCQQYKTIQYFDQSKRNGCEWLSLWPEWMWNGWYVFLDNCWQLVSRCRYLPALERLPVRFPIGVPMFEGAHLQIMRRFHAIEWSKVKGQIETEDEWLTRRQ